MSTLLKRWLRWQWLRGRVKAHECAEIHFPHGVKIHMQADDSSVVAYQIGNVDLRRRADDED